MPGCVASGGRHIGDPSASTCFTSWAGPGAGPQVARACILEAVGNTSLPHPRVACYAADLLGRRGPPPPLLCECVAAVGEAAGRRLPVGQGGGPAAHMPDPSSDGTYNLDSQKRSVAPPVWHIRRRWRRREGVCACTFGAISGRDRGYHWMREAAVCRRARMVRGARFARGEMNKDFGSCAANVAATCPPMRYERTVPFGATSRGQIQQREVGPSRHHFSHVGSLRTRDPTRCQKP